ncbi:flagellar basal body P-ring formation chaperone FlgA [Marinomonas mediterranea]|jgi:flagella basal body P-ring formation protein FlgA|uniref:Flagella basal body P-ring formation protein FlgA n=1 Tax=Marinomonas mediterranea (strain ATCC 700492 / JCM 21426 / NBRC 103028 / MMB-1) TaxID=717774 RepID=F2JT90_MARM1|nr:flagellar basal body P-ring formation chaperone FlgA [Marinomonas mediterranea]ADZ90308.1 flagella basal body P-ring formation protein FlgA [Marinomonas mediterranea MMB-1]WCN08368.1 flagellar basal body P-ring formation protein FlgA [Marinomonas mediterranea]WCN12424.1 flagellar basal body P-ring formation protein FlgA [Marinomonas mediterranea]WCN16497.1 flagellar basal body P-ring formation protein FlgA [Marinomonas mediterranea MMB-1]
MDSLYRYSIFILLIFFNNCSHATQIATQLQQFINEHEIPRLSNIYPNAEIKIELSNSTSLGYLPKCSNPITIKNQRPDATKRTNYAISCDTPTWKSFVPVSQSILIDGIKTSVPISRGSVITPTNTTTGKVDITTIRGHLYTAKTPPYGLVASRNIRINTFITDKITKQPILVKKGARVLITARSGRISVKMNGTALEDGAKGQQIRVKNASSGRIVYGKVVSDSEVLVNY